jgi:hypothetical protein
MGITLGWDNPDKTTIKATIAAPYTWEELFAHWDTAVAMINTVPQTVHVIVLSESSGFPPGNALEQLNRITPTVPHNMGLVVMVTSSRFIEVINDNLVKLSPRLSRRGRVVTSLDEAHALITAEGVPQAQR